MQKIFTLVLLSILTMMYVNATEETLWEGDFYVTWAEGNDESHKEWGNYNEDPTLNQDISYHFVAGTKINVYLKVNDMQHNGEVYHKCQFDNWDWQALPGLAAVEFSEDKVVTIDVTDELANAVAAKGFRLHGHGFNVVKVTKGEIEGETPATIEDLEAAVLWSGEHTISNWSGEGGIKINLEENGINKACNLYLLIKNYTGGNLRMVMNSGWVEYPSNEYDHLQNVDADNVVKVVMTQDFVDNVINSEYKEIIFWGNNVTIKSIATTKNAALNHTTAISSISRKMPETEGYFNLKGLRITHPTKGLYVKNGKKVIVK